MKPLEIKRLKLDKIRYESKLLELEIKLDEKDLEISGIKRKYETLISDKENERQGLLQQQEKTKALIDDISSKVDRDSV